MIKFKDLLKVLGEPAIANKERFCNTIATFVLIDTLSQND